MSACNFDYMSAVDLARHIQTRMISPLEVVKQSLARIESVNSRLNCFCFTYHDEAIEKAKVAEKQVMSGQALPPLHGVPIAFKDITPTRDKRTTLGSHIYKDWVPDFDAVVVERLVKAGAIIVGKTNTAEFAAAGFTESPLWGTTRNPWNLDYSPGGSSGGSGAAVAAGCVPLAEGSDMGGSVRIPASCCGIVGLKPSFGRIPFDIYPSQFDTYCHFGPLARSVSDAALFLTLTQGPDDRDILSLPSTIDVPVPVPPGVRGMRLAMSLDLGYYALDPEVKSHTLKVADALRAEGAIVDEVDLGWTREINDAGYRHWKAYKAAFLGQYLSDWRHLLAPYIVRSIEEGLGIGGVELKKLEFVRTKLWKTMATVLKNYEALICPTLALSVPRIEETDENYGHNDDRGRYYQYEMTLPFNMMSPCPALSVPSGLTKRGLPTGVQIVGRRYDELTVLVVGATIEHVMPLERAHPPI